MQSIVNCLKSNKEEWTRNVDEYEKQREENSNAAL